MLRPSATQAAKMLEGKGGASHARVARGDAQCSEQELKSAFYAGTRTNRGQVGRRFGWEPTADERTGGWLRICKRARSAGEQRVARVKKRAQETSRKAGKKRGRFNQGIDDLFKTPGDLE
eukprot:2581279-Pleurochrysis_carterae.AAC.2